MGRRRRGKDAGSSGSDDGDDDDLGLAFDFGAALDNMTEKSASTRMAAMSGLKTYFKTPPCHTSAVRHFHSLLSLCVRMVRGGKSAKEREAGAELFQLGCLIAGGEATVAMDEYMIGGLGDLATSKSPPTVQALSIQCISILTLISDDGPHETKAALEVILRPLMVGQSTSLTVSRPALSAASLLLPLLTPTLLSSPPSGACPWTYGSGDMSLMECLWSRGMEQLGMEKMDAEVRVGWGWLMGVLAEIVEDGAMPPSSFLSLHGLLEYHAGTSDKSLSAADKATLKGSFGMIAARVAGISRRVAAERGDLLDTPEHDTADVKSDLLNPEDVRGESESTPWALSIKIGGAKHLLTSLTLRVRHRELARVLGTAFQQEMLKDDAVVPAMLGFGGDNTTAKQILSKRDKRLMMSPNSEASRNRTKERNRDRDAVKRGFMAPDED